MLSSCSTTGLCLRRTLLAFAAAGIAASLCACGDSSGNGRTLTLHECHLPKLAQPAQCGELAVPEDHSTPGRTLRLFVAILPANTRSPNPDPLVLLPGGPGQSASALGPFAAELNLVRRTRDIVLFDPRGTGRSAPLDCPAFKPEGRAGFEIDPLPKVRQCLSELQTRGVDLRHYTTTFAVADLEAVRVALGYPQLNVWGGSYGSRVALEYLRRYPERVRSMILDGIAPPRMRITLDVWRTRDAALQNVLDACKTQKRCVEAHANPAATLDAIEQDLGPQGKRIELPDPRTGESKAVTLTFEHVIAALQPLTYAPELSSLIPEMLDRARAGDYAPLAAASVAATGDLSEQMSPALHYAVTCAEDVPRIAPGELAHDRAVVRGGTLAARIASVCDIWPHGSAPSDFGKAVKSDKPVLLLSGGLDPVTPPAYGEEVARTLPNSRHIVAQGYGHIVSPRACAPRLITAFVDDAGFANLPQSCVDYFARSARPPFFTDRLAAQP